MAEGLKLDHETSSVTDTLLLDIGYKISLFELKNIFGLDYIYKSQKLSSSLSLFYIYTNWIFLTLVLFTTLLLFWELKIHDNDNILIQELYFLGYDNFDMPFPFCPMP